MLWSVDTQARTLLLLQTNRSCSVVNVDTVRRVETCTPPPSTDQTEAGTDTDTAVELMAKLAIQTQKKETMKVGQAIVNTNDADDGDTMTGQQVSYLIQFACTDVLG